MGLNLNGKQVIAIVVAVLSVLAGSTAQLTDIFGPHTAKTIIALASIGTGTLSAVLALISGQGSQVKDVLSMPGVERIFINGKANATLATMAVDPKLENIEATASALSTVTKTAADAAS